jgi:glycosyltransferase involved in cell wall biosynthesis
MTRQVLVVNHFAVPPGEPGGTRHVELFTRLDGWSALITAARINLSTRRRQVDRLGFRFLPVTPYRSNGPARVVNWLSFGGGVVAMSVAAPRIRPDLVYASSPHLFAALAGDWVARRYRVPFVLEVRDLWPQVLVDMGQVSQSSPVLRALTRLEEYLYGRADAIVVLAEGVRDALVRRGVDPRRLSVIPNGSDPASFDQRIDREGARRAAGFNRLTALYAGAHGPANGLELLLDAAAKLSDVGIDLVLVGDGVRRPALMREAQERRLDNVRFLPAVPKMEIPRLLLAADIGIHCLADVDLFRYGVSPNKVFDYMAAGLPVLTNSPGEVTQLVEKADAGIVVQPLDIESGLRAMVTAGPDALARWGTNGRAFVASHRSWPALAGQVRCLLDAVVENQQPSADRAQRG